MSLFEQDGATTNTPADPPKDGGNQQNTSTTDQPFLVVGERAFHKQEDVVTKISHADEHIAKLEAEAAELRTKLQEASTLESVVDALKSGAPTPSVPQSKAEPQNVDISTEVRKVMTQLSEEQVQAANISEATKPFIDAANGNAEEAKAALASKCREVGITVDTAKAIAGNSPTAFFKMLGIDPQQANSQVNKTPDLASTSTVNSSAMNQALGHKPGGYRDMMKQWKEEKNAFNKSSIMNAMTEKMRQDPNFRST